MYKVELNKLIETTRRTAGVTCIPSEDYLDFTHPLKLSTSAPHTNVPTSRPGAIKPTCVSECNATAELHLHDEKRLEELIVYATDLPRNALHEREAGTDALAWYKSFHRTNHWGIYIPYSGLLRMASHFLGCVNQPSVAVQVAWRALMAHELIHFGIDVACARAEILTNTSVYLSGQLKFRSPQGHIPLEECLAEGSLLRAMAGFVRNNDLQNQLADRQAPYIIARGLSSASPSGYRDGYQAQKVPDFLRFANTYLEQMISVNAPTGSLSNLAAFDASSLLPFKIEDRRRLSLGKIDPTDCRVYVFDDLTTLNLANDCMQFISALSNISESHAFMNSVTPNFISDWIKTKQQLGDPSIPKHNPNLDFKRWPQDDNFANNTRSWSVRVGGKRSNYRAHLDQDQKSNQWTAVKFGDADKLGHHKNRK